MGAVVFVIMFVPVLMIGSYCADQLIEFQKFVDDLDDTGISSRPEIYNHR